MMVLQASTIVLNCHAFMNHMATLLFTLPTMIPVIQKPTAIISVLIQRNLQFRHLFMELHTWTTVCPASLLVPAISISWRLKKIDCHRIVARRIIDQCTGASSTTSAELPSMSFSGILQCQPSATSLCPTLYLQTLNTMSYSMGIDSSKLSNVCYNSLADPHNLHDDENTCFFCRNPVECIEFLMQQLAFREHLSYALAKEFNDPE